jgi:hypothetical protein
VAKIPPGPLPEYFRVALDKPSSWILECLRCTVAWELKKPADPARPVHPGNLLELLNHAHSHKPVDPGMQLPNYVGKLADDTPHTDEEIWQYRAWSASVAAKAVQS